MSGMKRPADKSNSIPVHLQREQERRAARIYYRCRECCLVVAADGGMFAETECACGGVAFDDIGMVGGSGRLESDAVRSVCDDRCTNAQGPECWCQCGGQNHGSKMVVRIIRDVGQAPRIEVLDDAKIAAAKARRAEIIGLRERAASAGVTWRANHKHAEIAARKARREFLPEADYRIYIEGLRWSDAIEKACDAKQHKTRVRKLNALIKNGAP